METQSKKLIELSFYLVTGARNKISALYYRL